MNSLLAKTRQRRHLAWLLLCACAFQSLLPLLGHGSLANGSLANGSLALVADAQAAGTAEGLRSFCRLPYANLRVAADDTAPQDSAAASTVCPSCLLYDLSHLALAGAIAPLHATYHPGAARYPSGDIPLAAAAPHHFAAIRAPPHS